MQVIGEILASVEFWKVVVPAGLAILVWGWNIRVWRLNEESKRNWDQFKRREEHYRELLRSLGGFYEPTSGKVVKTTFLDQVNLCWLYVPDEVVRKAYAFLASIDSAQPRNDPEELRRLGDLALAIRRDLLKGGPVKTTNLTASDFKHLIAD